MSQAAAATGRRGPAVATRATRGGETVQHWHEHLYLANFAGRRPNDCQIKELHLRSPPPSPRARSSSTAVDSNRTQQCVPVPSQVNQVCADTNTAAATLQSQSRPPQEEYQYMPDRTSQKKMPAGNVDFGTPN